MSLKFSDSGVEVLDLSVFVVAVSFWAIHFWASFADVEVTATEIPSQTESGLEVEVNIILGEMATVFDFPLWSRSVEVDVEINGVAKSEVVHDAEEGHEFLVKAFDFEEIGGVQTHAKTANQEHSVDAVVSVATEPIHKAQHSVSVNAFENAVTLIRHGSLVHVHSKS